MLLLMATGSNLAYSTSLGVIHLERFWSLHVAGRAGQTSTDNGANWVADNLLLSGLRLGLRETFDYLFARTPSLEEFEAWILEKNGGALDPIRVQCLNAALNGAAIAPPFTAVEPPLTKEDLEFWGRNGYVVVHDAVSPAQCQAAAQAIYEFLEMHPELPETWYTARKGEGVWVPLLHHPALQANRESPRIRGAFAQLWGRDDLWVNVDQAGMNPPERPGWHYPGTGLHFDVSLELPIPFGVQGILYLTDTAADQGAFTCVPGFHRNIESWLNNLPPGSDPRTQNLYDLGPVPIAGRAGDFIIWHHALPHAGTPNRASRPRVVQYTKWFPSQWEHNPRWR
jgi:hypothetical protein